MVDKYVQNIYNSYLKITRTKQNLPFRYRKNFDGFEDTNQYLSCEKLKRFYYQNKFVDVETFFSAPFELFDDFSPDLTFYTTPKAIKCYRLYKEKKELQNPDSDDNFEKTKESLVFIVNYCKENDLKLNQYLECDSAIPKWVRHFKEGKINSYSIVGFDGFKQVLDGLEVDIRELYVSNLYKNYIKFRKNFNDSEKTKKLLEKVKKYFNI